MSLNPTKATLGLLAPLLTALSAWLTASVAKYGVHLDSSGVNAALVSGATCAIAVVIKLIHDVEQDPKVKAVEPDVDLVEKLLEQADPHLREAVSEEVKLEIERQISDLAHQIDPPAATPNADTGVTASLEAGPNLDAHEDLRSSSVELPASVQLPASAEQPASVELPASAEQPLLEEPPAQPSPTEQQWQAALSSAPEHSPEPMPALTQPAGPLSSTSQPPRPNERIPRRG